MRIDLDSDISHSQVMVKGYYLFIDTWDGELGYMDVDGSRIWSSSMSHSSGGSTCGRTDSSDQRHYITETESHTADTLELSAGSFLDQDPGDESYAIDETEVWIR